MVGRRAVAESLPAPVWPLNRCVVPCSNHSRKTANYIFLSHFTFLYNNFKTAPRARQQAFFFHICERVGIACKRAATSFILPHETKRQNMRSPSRSYHQDLPRVAKPLSSNYRQARRVLYTRQSPPRKEKQVREFEFKQNVAALFLLHPVHTLRRGERTRMFKNRKHFFSSKSVAHNTSALFNDTVWLTQR